MTTAIMFANQKGGVGKTTSVNEIGHIFATQFGRKVLMIDLDAQCNLTECCGIEPQKGQTIYDAITGERSFADTIIHIKDNLDILAGHRRMLSQYFNGVDDITALKDAREILEETTNYEYILIDVGPEAGHLMTMALLASDYVIAVSTLSKLSYSGVVQMCSDIQKGKKHYVNFNVKPLGILINNAKNLVVARINQEKFEKLTKEFGAPLFETMIKSCCIVEECKELSQSVIEYDPKHKVAKQYMQLAKEIEDRIWGEV